MLKQANDGISQVTVTPGEPERLIEKAIHHINERDFEKGMVILKELETGDRRPKDKSDLARNLGLQSIILAEQNQFDSALNLLIESENLYRQAENLPEIASSMEKRAVLLGFLGSIDEALQYFEKAEQIFRDINSPRAMFACLFNHATLLFKKTGNPRAALHLMNEAYDLALTHELVQEIEISKNFLDDIRSNLTFTFI